MADVKISALTADASVGATDEFEKNEGGTSKKTTARKLIPPRYSNQRWQRWMPLDKMLIFQRLIAQLMY